MKTWFITGASRGFGVEIAKAAMRVGDRVVATGRHQTAVSTALGEDNEQLLTLTLDVTDFAAAKTAVKAALIRFGAIDVLVNNAGYGHLGFFEEITVDDVREQFATNLFGVFNVTWAVLPGMRAAKQGLIFNISSIAGFYGAELGSLYSASKFALEGFSESLAKEVERFGIHVSIIEPGPFRTDFLSPESIRFGGVPIADYDERRAELIASFEKRNGLQPGDPVRLADALVRLASESKPPMRLPGGSIAVNLIDTKLEAMRRELEQWRQTALEMDGSYEVNVDPRL